MNPLALAAVPFLLASVCTAQEEAKSPPKEAPKAAPKEPFVVEAGEIELPALIDRCAAYLDCNILLQPMEVKITVLQPIRLQKAISTDRDGCVEFLASTLIANNFALTFADEKNHTLEAIYTHGPRAREVSARARSRSEQEVLARPHLMMPVTVALTLQHTDGMIACNALRPYFATTGMAGATSLTLGTMGNNSLLITGKQDRVAQAIRMVRELDKPAPAGSTPPEATKRIEKLEKRLREFDERLEKRLADLEAQIQALTDKLAEATKPK